jgi:hypothetical protein
VLKVEAYFLPGSRRLISCRSGILGLRGTPWAFATFGSDRGNNSAQWHPQNNHSWSDQPRTVSLSLWCFCQALAENLANRHRCLSSNRSKQCQWLYSLRSVWYVCSIQTNHETHYQFVTWKINEHRAILSKGSGGFRGKFTDRSSRKDTFQLW